MQQGGHLAGGGPAIGLKIKIYQGRTFYLELLSPSSLWWLAEHVNILCTTPIQISLDKQVKQLVLKHSCALQLQIIFALKSCLWLPEN